MSQLVNRLNKLEHAAAQSQPAPQTAGFGQTWFLLNWIYNRDTPLPPDELARLDTIDPRPLLLAELERTGAGHETD